MICRCIGNSIADLPAESVVDFCRDVHLDRVDLVVGRDYPVYGVLFRNGRPWFLVCEEEEDEYPTPQFGELFELIDPRIPPDWSLVIADTNVGHVALLPRLWADNPSFLEELVDGEQGPVKVFENMKRMLRVWHATSK